MLACGLMSYGQTAVDLRTQGRNADFSGAIYTKPAKTGTTLPGNCSVGEIFFKSDAAPGANLFACTAASTWTLLSAALSATGVGAGTYGSATEVPRITVDAQGRVTALSIETVASGTTQSSQLTDCRIEMSGATANIRTPCQIRIGTTTHILLSDATATLSGASDSGTVYFYWDSNGVLIADAITAATLTCNANCQTAATGAFPLNATPIGSVTFSLNIFQPAGVVDRRSVYSNTTLVCGSGLTCTTDSLTGTKTIAADGTFLTASAQQGGLALLCSGSGGASAYSCQMSPPLTSYTSGQVIQFRPEVTSSGSATLSINGLPARSIMKADGTTDLSSGDLTAGMQIPLVYDGTVFRLPAPVSTGGSLPASYSALAGSPCGAGNQGQIALLTSGFYSAARCNGSAWSFYADGREASPPAGTWNWDNQATASLDTAKGAHSLIVPVTHSGGLAVRYQTAPAAPFTRTFFLRFYGTMGESGGLAQYGVGFRDAEGRLHSLQITYSSDTSETKSYAFVRRWDNATTPASIDFDGVSQGAGFWLVPNGGVYLRIEDTGAELRFSISMNGDTFDELVAVSRTAHLSSPSQIMFFNGAPTKRTSVLDAVSIQ